MKPSRRERKRRRQARRNWWRSHPRLYRIWRAALYAQAIEDMLELAPQMFSVEDANFVPPPTNGVIGRSMRIPLCLPSSTTSS